MRRMRSHWQYVLFAVPVVVVAWGVTYLSKHPSRFPKFSRAPASTLKQNLAKLEEDKDEPSQDLKEESLEHRIAAIKAHDSEGESRGPASANLCHSEEYPGAALEHAQISKKDWEHIMDEFHDAKALLTAWLKDHKGQFSEKTYQWMSTRVTEAKLQRPSDEEPDLAWRGMGVLADSRAAPLIRVGGGFGKWLSASPRRARFELTRLMAQSWAPCEMAKVDATGPWNGFLSCMEVGNEADPAKACGSGTYSEAGWAVSTAVAAVASPPGCRVPAFEKASAAECMKKMGASL